MEKFSGLWLLLKGQSLEILLRVNTSIMKEEILSIKGGFTKPKMLTPQSQNFLTLCTNILAKSAPNKKLIKSVHQGPGWVRIMKKNRGGKSPDTLPKDFRGSVFHDDLKKYILF